MTTATLALPADPEVVAATDTLTRDEWLDLRRHGIGGSDAAAIAGLDPYRSAFAVYLDKVGMAPPDEDSEPAYWGRELEPFVARRFARETGRHVIDLPQLLRSRTHPFALANVDRLTAPAPDVAPDRVLEAKTTSAWNPSYVDGSGTDGLPDRAAVQVMHYLGVTGYTEADVAVLIGGQRFRNYHVERDDELIANIFKLEAEFWQQVLDRVPPAPDAAALELLAHLYDVKPGSVVTLDDHLDDVETLTRRRQVAKEQIKALEAEADDAQAKLCALLGENEIGTIAGQPAITWKRGDRAGYTVAPKTGIRTFNVVKRYGESVLRHI